MMENNQDIQAYRPKKPAIWHATTALAALVVLLQVIGIIYYLITKMYKGSLSEYGSTLFSLTLTQLCVMLPVPFLLLYFTRNDVLYAVRLKKGINALQVLLLLLLVVPAVFFANGLNSLFLKGLEALGYHQITALVPDPQTSLQAFSGVLVIAILPAFAEEFMFRGLVMRSFERYSPWAAALCSAALFGFMHGTWEQVFFAFILGLVLSYVVLITDSLWASATIHFANNAFSVIASYLLAKYMPDLFNEAQNVNPSDEYISLAIFIIGGAVGLAVILSLFTLYTRHRNTKKYGSPLPAALKDQASYPRAKHPVLQYLPLLVFFGVEILQMYLLWAHPELFGFGS